MASSLVRVKLVWLAAFALAGCGGSAGPAASPSASPARAATPTPVPIRVTSAGNGKYTTITQSKAGRKIYTIRATSYTGLTDSGVANAGSIAFQSPQITFIDRSGQSVVADAPKAEVRSSDKSVLMTGGVRARTQTGGVLTCDRLRYDGRTEALRGNGHVVLTSPNGVQLTGNTLDGDAHLGIVHIVQ